jgi:hypothetical protein
MKKGSCRMLKKLPIGIQTFQRLREENYFYIDKTQDLLEVMDDSIYLFLSRPRRFGKSLFLDTIRCAYEGRAELFEGLYIADKWNFSKKHPVIKIDFFGDLRSGEALKKTIMGMLRSNQEKLGVACRDDESDFGGCFRELIEKTHNKYNQKVVVLIDEYDKAILDNLDQMEVAFENREIIKALYTVLKGSEPYLEKVFLTGVSKFSKASIFSGLNMLKDISLAKKYGNVCGYTQADIESSLLPYLEGVDLEKLKEWYNGYNFLKDDVYNPFDILLFIDNDFLYKSYWFETGTPSYLIKLMQEKKYFLPNFSNITVGEELLDSFDINNIELEVILYQAGYLTIERVEIDEDLDSVEYKLKIPNKEVKISLNNYIINSFMKKTDYNKDKKGVIQSLKSADFPRLKEVLSSIFASIPYNHYTKNNIEIYEGFYASILYVYFQSLGISIIGEDVTNKGRIDLTLFVEDKIFIVEFKIDEGDPLAQIHEKRYYQKYQNQGKEIYLVGINFSKESKNITTLKWESL